MAKPLRKQIEILSTPILLRISSWPKAIVPLLLLAFLLVGLFVPGVVGGFFILLVGLFVGWLLYLSWPLLAPGARILRLIAVAVILGSALTQIFLV
jgi:hypothetical protein